jgi:ribosomal protein S27E
MRQELAGSDAMPKADGECKSNSAQSKLKGNYMSTQWADCGATLVFFQHAHGATCDASKR